MDIEYNVGSGNALVTCGRKVWDAYIDNV
jgi:hypothetical protein